jgi:type II secretory pathway pseudopilin PulG
MKKRALTLLEIMIVIFLITLITGTIGYSMRGTLDKGRAFRTERGLEQLHDLLLICLAESDKATAAEIASAPSEHLKQTGLAKDPKGLVLDGWKEPFKITVTANGTDFNIKSDKLIAYNAKTKRNTPGSTEPASAEDD